MILVFVGMAIALFVLVALLPVTRLALSGLSQECNYIEENSRFIFNDELFDLDINDTKCAKSKAERKKILEAVGGGYDTKTRGSVRMALGNVLTEDDMNGMREAAYSKTLS